MAWDIQWLFNLAISDTSHNGAELTPPPRLPNRHATIVGVVLVWGHAFSPTIFPRPLRLTMSMSTNSGISHT